MLRPAHSQSNCWRCTHLLHKQHTVTTHTPDRDNNAAGHTNHTIPHRKSRERERENSPPSTLEKTQTVPSTHLDAQHTLAQHDVAHCRVDVHARGVAGGHHVAVLELHALRTLGAQLAGNNDLRVRRGSEEKAVKSRPSVPDAACHTCCCCWYCSRCVWGLQLWALHTSCVCQAAPLLRAACLLHIASLGWPAASGDRLAATTQAPCDWQQW